jgi:hypothetical protein
MMNQAVHIAAEVLTTVPVTQDPGTRRVGEGATAFEVDSVNRFRIGIEQEPEGLFRLARRFVGTVTLNAHDRAYGVHSSRVELPAVCG